MWETHFWINLHVFIDQLKIQKLERYKVTYVQTQRYGKADIFLGFVGWVNSEKIGLYKSFPNQDVISYIPHVIQVVGLCVPPQHGRARAVGDGVGAVTD